MKPRKTLSIKPSAKIPKLIDLVFNRPHLIARERLTELASLISDGVPILAQEDDPEDEVNDLLDHPDPESDIDPDQKFLKVIEISGTMTNRSLPLDALSGLSSYETIRSEIESGLEDDSVVGMLLRFDSPGGVTSGAFDLADFIRSAGQQKPIWSSIDDMAASAAYLFASQTQRVFVSRTSAAGSIGVVATLIDQTERDKMQGFKYHVLESGEGKAAFNPHTSIPDSALEQLQAEIDRIYGMVISAVVSGRPGVTEQFLRNDLGARLVFGPEAVRAGLADEVRPFDQAVSNMKEEVRMSKTSVSAPAAKGAEPKPKVEAPEPKVETQPERVPEPKPEPPSADSGYTLTDAREVAELCELVGRPDLITKYQSAELKPSEVRKKLFEMRNTDDGKTEVNSSSPSATPIEGAGDVGKAIVGACEKIAADMRAERRTN